MANVGTSDLGALRQALADLKHLNADQEVPKSFLKDLNPSVRQALELADGQAGVTVADLRQELNRNIERYDRQFSTGAVRESAQAKVNAAFQVSPLAHTAARLASQLVDASKPRDTPEKREFERLPPGSMQDLLSKLSPPSTRNHLPPLEEGDWEQTEAGYWIHTNLPPETRAKIEAAVRKAIEAAEAAGFEFDVSTIAIHVINGPLDQGETMNPTGRANIILVSNPEGTPEEEFVATVLHELGHAIPMADPGLTEPDNAWKEDGAQEVLGDILVGLFSDDPDALAQGLKEHYEAGVTDHNPKHRSINTDTTWDTWDPAEGKNSKYLLHIPILSLAGKLKRAGVPPKQILQAVREAFDELRAEHFRKDETGGWRYNISVREQNRFLTERIEAKIAAYQDQD